MCLKVFVLYSDTNRATILPEQKPPIQEHAAGRALCYVLSHPCLREVLTVLHSVHGVTDFILKIASCQSKQLKLTGILTDQSKMITPKALSVCTSVLCCQKVCHPTSYMWWYCLRQTKKSCASGTGFSESQEKSKHATEKLPICIICYI